LKFSRTSVEDFQGLFEGDSSLISLLYFILCRKDLFFGLQYQEKQAFERAFASKSFLKMWPLKKALVHTSGLLFDTSKTFLACIIFQRPTQNFVLKENFFLMIIRLIDYELVI